MTQHNIKPIDGTDSGVALRLNLDSFEDAQNTLHSGATRPSYAQAGMAWIKQVSGTLWELNIFDGTTDVVIATINPSTGVFSLPNDSVGNAAMQANAVNTGNIVNQAITAGKLAVDAVETAKIADAAVTRAKIQAGAVDLLKIDSNRQATAQQIRGGALVNNGLLLLNEWTDAQLEVAIPFSASVDWAVSDGLNRNLDTITSNFSFNNPSGNVVGRFGTIRGFTTGGPFTVSWGSNFRDAPTGQAANLPSSLPANRSFTWIYYIPFSGQIVIWS